MSSVIQFFGNLDLRALTPPEVRLRKSEVQLYRLLVDFTVFVPYVGRITVPAGFETDFASIPRIVWSWLSPEDPVILFPSIVHDYLYSMRGMVEGLPAVTREQADDVLRDAMLACGARSSQAWVVHKAVRMGGASHWKS